MGAPLRSPRFWARVGAVVSLLLAGWFVWGMVVVLLWRREAYGVARVPVSPWPVVNALVFLALAVAAMRERERARPWMLGSGLITVMLSAIATRVNPWDWVAVALGALLAGCAVLWERAARAAA